MTHADPKAIEVAVLAVLMGNPATEIAEQMSLPVDDLLTAAGLYRVAGYAALEDRGRRDGWQQVRIDFADWHTAEQIGVTRLRPALAQAETDGILTRWFFTRKAASWRLRCQGRTGNDGADKRGKEVSEFLAGSLDAMAVRGDITGWSPAIYEMETHAFGGHDGMELAHQLFHTDSAAILGHLANADPQSLIHRRRAELSILLCSLLLCSAGQDWYEAGDVWAQVAAHRAPAAGIESNHDRTRTALRRLLTADTGPSSSLVNNSPLTPFADWAASFHHAGKGLRRLFEDASLDRGLRAVLAHHILFHWNRMGLPSDIQGTLAAHVRDIVMNGAGDVVSTPGVGVPAPTLHGMRTDTTDANMAIPETQNPEHLRNALVDKLRDRGAVRSPEVEAAMRIVPRHLFLPEFSVTDGYADTQIVTKTDADGAALSSVSHPGVVAGMLEALDVRPSHRVLEIGSGGYNAAILTHLVGPRGHVTTLDIDPDVTDRTQRCLTAAKYHHVQVVTADGEYGHPQGAPYDRIIVTVGAWDLPPAWFHQLEKTDGRLIVPLRMRALSRIVTFAPEKGTWRSRSIQFAGFVPMRGDGAHTAYLVLLTPDGEVQVQTDEPADATALGSVLDQPASEAWTGVTIPHGTSYEHLDLWLAGMPGFSRLTATSEAIARGVVTPTFPWGGSAVHDGDTVAYLTERVVAPQTDTTECERGVSEVGVRAHGPASEQLAQTVADRIRLFDREHHAVIEVRPHNEDSELRGDAVIAKRHVRLILSWE
ncbi:MAG: methyltransferase, FxLD system [Pseudonocardiaceae bacterium]